jgi:hypothetical protein
MLSAINHKLSQYPDFAASAGLQVVNDCDGGRAFMLAYASYAASHPGFDADEPPAPALIDDPDATPPPDASSATISKISGVPDTVVNNPVVQLVFSTCSRSGCPNAGNDWITSEGDGRNALIGCSGVFIAKNWILTAAHCLTWAAVDLCMEAGVARDQCQPDWPQWGQWRIKGTYTTDLGSDGLPGGGDDSSQSYQLSNVWARGYVQENWVGRDPHANKLLCATPATCFDPDVSSEHDVALLYIRSDNDYQLPPRVEWDNAKRISFNPNDEVPVPADPNPMSIYGYSTGGGSFANAALKKGAGDFGTRDVQPNRIGYATIATPLNPNPQWPCTGDSGGPLVRTGLTLDTHLGPQDGLEAVVGVISTVSSRDFGTSAYCGSAPPALGTEVDWNVARVDRGVNHGFIQKTINRWTNTQFFSCTDRALLNGLPPEITAQECWGAPCTSDGPPPDGCALATETCWSPARVVAQRRSCTACKGFAGDTGNCDCIQGQCLPTQ